MAVISAKERKWAQWFMDRCLRCRGDKGYYSPPIDPDGGEPRAKDQRWTRCQECGGTGRAPVRIW